MKISVVTPTKNRPEAVELCRRWFLNQVHPIHEHIVIEGGGMNENLCEGIRKATGDVVVLADDDDYYGPKWARRIARIYRDPSVRAAGQLLDGLYHLRGERRWEIKHGPLSGTISFRREEADRLIDCINFDGRAKRILREVPHYVSKTQHCYRMMGLYHPQLPGRGVSRKHSADSFPIPDPGLRFLRLRIGDKVVDAYIDAMEKIDTRLLTSQNARRLSQFPHYERPSYFGVMKPWRQDILKGWLAQFAAGRTYLDVGCGPAESLEFAANIGIHGHGCEVVQSVCNRDDVDLIPGAHDLSIYRDNQFDILTCNDVLEHILEEDVPSALREMSRVSSRAILLGICQEPGPWHPCIQSTEWWLERISENMTGAATLVYGDQIPEKKEPYIWVDIKC